MPGASGAASQPSSLRALRPERESLFPQGSWGRIQLGSQDPYPALLACAPTVLQAEDEPEAGEEEELVIRLPLALTWCYICSLPSSFCPQWSHPFQKVLAGNREAGGEQELGELEKTALI